MFLVFALFLPFIVNAASFGTRDLDLNRTLGVRKSSIFDAIDTCTKSYMVGTQKVTWYQALVLCQQNGMELATVGSAQEEAVIEALLAGYSTTIGPNQGYWISAARMGSCNNGFVFVSNGKPVIYSAFALGQPDNAGGVEGCVEIYKESDKKYLWNDLPCDNSNNMIGFICQTKNSC